MSQRRSRRSHARSDLVRILRGAMEAVVLALAALTPWAFGGVDPVFELAIAGALALLLALWAALTVVSGNLTIVRCPVTLVLSLIFIVGIVQLVPLPPALLRVISPGAAEIQTNFYPAEPELLSRDEAVPGRPAWPTISVYPYATRTDLFRWLAVLVLFAAVRNQIASTGSLTRLAWVMLVNGCLLALYGMVQFFRVKAPSEVEGVKSIAQSFGPFMNRNHFAAYLNLCIAISVGLLVGMGPSAQDKKQRYMVKPNAQEEQREVLGMVLSPLVILHSPIQLWTCVGIALMAASVLVSLSRGGVAALFIALIATMCLRLKWPIRVRRFDVLIVPTVLIVGLFAFVGFRPLETRLGSFFKGTQSLGDTRLPLWGDLISLAPRFWLLGSGYGTLGYVEPLARQPGTFPDPAIFVDHAHNDYLEALIEGGIVRAVLTVVLVGLVFAIGFQALRRYSGRTPGALAVGAMTAFLAIALHSAVDFSITTPAVAILATIIVAQLVALNRADPTKPPSYDYAHANAMSLGVAGRLTVGVTSLLLGGLLVAHFWQADRVHRLKMAAFYAVGTEKPDRPANHDEAVKYLKAAVLVAPDDAELQADLAQAYLDLAPEEREPYLSRLRVADRTPFTWLSIGMGNSLGAATAVAVWPDLRQPRTDRLPEKDRAALFQAVTKPALQHFAVARRACPLLPKPHMRFATHATELVADTPRKYWERAIRVAPTDPDLYYFAGLQALQDRRPNDALAFWRTALDLSPWPIYPEQQRKHLDRLHDIITAALPTLGPDPRQRDQRLEQMLPDRPEDLEAAARMVDPNLSLTGPAKPIMARALALLDRPEGLTAEQYFKKARICRSLSDPDAAIRAYDLSLKLAPTQVPAPIQRQWRTEYVKLLMEQRRWKDAYRELEILQKKEPDAQEVRDWMNEVNRELKIDFGPK